MKRMRKTSTDKQYLQKQIINIPMTLEVYLKDISYPSEKKELLQHAQHNSAPYHIIDLLACLEDKNYKNILEIVVDLFKV